jgi:L-lactate dehydrogenase complex protein LldG
MTSARDEVLRRVAAALRRQDAPEEPLGTQVPRRYRESADPGPAGGLADRLAERLRDYGSTVRRATPGTLTAVAAAALAERGARRVVVPPGLDLPGLDLAGLGVGLIVDDGLDAAALDRVDGVITGAAVAVAETGTIVLDGSPGQGRRALTLIPDYHLCILAEAQIVGLVPEALLLLPPGQPLTWISGPSATSDIELDRVQGVHGPRTLDVILAGPGPDPGSGCL